MSIAFAIPTQRSHAFYWLIRLQIALASLLNFAYLLGYLFLERPFSAAFFYHLDPTLFSGGILEYLSWFFLGALYILFTGWVIIARPPSSSFECSKLIKLLIIVICFSFLTINSPVQGLADYVLRNYFVQKHHFQQAKEIVFKDKRNLPNLVFVYLESLERTYLNQKVFPDLTPQLTKISKQSLDFTNIKQLPNTEWTIGGMVASQCGVPLYAPVGTGGNSCDAFKQFMPGANCLGDILSEKGYQVVYMGGASNEFGGKENFLKSHGFDEVIGLQKLRKLQSDPDNISAWGIYDYKLFAFAKDKFDQLASQKQPFAFFILNLATHHPKGIESSFCNNFEYRDGENPLLNAVNCVDNLLGNFHRYVRNSKVSEDTIFVIASDHLQMQSTTTDLLQSTGRRRNLFLIDSPEYEPKRINKPGASFDIAPTVLDVMGATNLQLNLGRSLLSGPGGVYRKEISPDRYVRSVRDQVLKMWNLNTSITKENISIDLNNKEIQIGQNSYQIPVALSVKDLQINRVWNLEDMSSKEFFYKNPKSSVIIVDRCKHFPFWLENNCEANYALFVGSAANKDNIFKPLDQSYDLQASKVINYLEREPDPYNLFTRLKNQIKILSIDSDTTSLPNIYVKSVGGLGEQSKVNIFSLNLNFKGLSRGLNVFGLKKSGEIKLVANFDTYNNPKALNEAQPLKKLVQEKIDARWALLVGHDSIVSDKLAGISGLANDFKLPHLSSISLREPYIALVDLKSKKAIEYVGPSESVLEASSMMPEALKKSQTTP